MALLTSAAARSHSKASTVSFTTTLQLQHRLLDRCSCRVRLIGLVAVAVGYGRQVRQKIHKKKKGGNSGKNDVAFSRRENRRRSLVMAMAQISWSILTCFFPRDLNCQIISWWPLLTCFSQPDATARSVICEVRDLMASSHCRSSFRMFWHNQHKGALLIISYY